MSGMASIAFVVCRESVEALLVLGILNAWLSHNLDAGEALRGRRRLWLGAASGVAVAALFGTAILGFESLLPDEAQDYFQVATVLLAALLILQMVFWMRRHGPELKRQLEGRAGRSGAGGDGWGLYVLALVAVAREGSETVVFLYGILAGGGYGQWPTLAAILAGFGAAGLLYWLLQLGGRRLSWRRFFRATEVMLLLLAAALVMSGADGLVSLGLLPAWGGVLWDSSALLDDAGGLGGLVASLTGYRARPDLTAVLVYVLYWTVVAAGFARAAPRPSPA